MMTRLNNLSSKFSKVNGEDRQGIFMVKIMVREIIKIDTDQIMEIAEYHSVVEDNMDRIVEMDKGIIGTIEVTLEDEILEEISEQIRITEVKIIEVDID